MATLRMIDYPPLQNEEPQSRNELPPTSSLRQTLAVDPKFLFGV